MTFNLDSTIFISFLVANVIFGLYSSRGIKNIKEYAIGDRNFSTGTIAATLVATWVSGSDFFTYLTEAYNNGLYFIWAATGDVFCLLMVGLFFAPRLGEFLGKLSIAEAMGELYGKHVRIITAIAGCIGAGGLIAVQLKVAGMLFEYCFNMPSIYGVVIGGGIVTLYSTLGGIKSVTFTDIIQLFTFGTIIPAIAFFIIGTLDDINVLTDVVSTHELFDYKQVFDFSQPKSFSYLLLFFFIAVPGFNPAIFQRIAMAKSTLQVRKSFVIAGLTCFFITITMSLIGILLLSTQPNLDSNDIVKHLIFNFPYTGIKGLILAGAMAMVMSTADSYINSTAVLVIHDFCKPLKLNFVTNELNATRLISFLVGIMAILLGLSGDRLLDLIITTNTFYLPVVTVPFILTVLGFRSTGKSVLIGMLGGFASVLICKIILKVESIESVIPAMVANLVFLIGSHYLLKQPGGWVGIKDQAPLQAIRQQRRYKWQKFLNSIKNFNLVTILKNNTPSQETVYVFGGVFCMVFIYSTMYSLPKEIQVQYSDLLSFLPQSILFSATALISYPLWPVTLKQSSTAGLVWNFVMFYVLICVGFLFVVISNFAPMQLIIFMVNLMVLATLVRWQLALVMIITGLVATIQCFKYYLGTDILENVASVKYKMIYLLLIISSTLIAFIRPKQEQQQLEEEKNTHLTGRIHDREKALETAEGLKEEFIRNLTHEFHAPMTGIMSTAEALHYGYDKLPDDVRKNAIDNIYRSSIRLEAFEASLVSLSKLSNANYKFNIQEVNLAQLIYTQLETCKKLYIEERDQDSREFITDIEEDLLINGDEYYLKQTIDNLIINAITYCKSGKIIISLKRNGNEINFAIQDEGVGIPEEELYDIFGAFNISSRTRTYAGGRGVGLALCKKVIDLHGGKIWAENSPTKGAVFKFIIKG